MKRIVRIVLCFMCFVFLTVISQVGGVVVLLVWVCMKRFSLGSRKRLLVMGVAYALSVCLLVPIFARLGGRVPLPMHKTGALRPHSYVTILLNRHYVRKDLYADLMRVAEEYTRLEGGPIVYLDANFPFFDGFPLLPHLSHNDGEKVDLSFQYTADGKPTDKKPSRSGYGYFEEPQGDQKSTSDTLQKAWARFI